MLIVFLGPDGSGKTTIINLLEKKLKEEYPHLKIEKRYWRPGILKAPGVLLGLREEIQTGVNPDPYGHEKEFWGKSLLRFTYYLVDYILGSIEMKINKNTIYLYDRYYCDMWIDKFRYNFTLPDWVIKAGRVLVKKPDVVFYLDAPVEILLKRKKEIPEKELRKNIQRYRNFIDDNNGIIVKNTGRTEETLSSILSHLPLQEKKK